MTRRSSAPLSPLGGVSAQALVATGFALLLLAGPSPALSAGMSGFPDDRPAGHPSAVCEPNVREVQEAAARYARLTPAALDHLSHAGRGAALLPLVRVLYRDITTDSNRDSTTASGGATTALALNTGIGWEVSLEWRLDQLANPTRVQAAREVNRLEERRSALLAEVTRVYFERRRGLLDLADLQGKERASRQIDVDELTGNLDALTGGWFSRRLEGKERPR